MDETLASPCTKICVMDAASGLCRGCRRTLDEVAGWLTMSEAERAAVLCALPERSVDPASLTPRKGAAA